MHCAAFCGSKSIGLNDIETEQLCDTFAIRYAAPRLAHQMTFRTNNSVSFIFNILSQTKVAEVTKYDVGYGCVNNCAMFVQLETEEFQQMLVLLDINTILYKIACIQSLKMRLFLKDVFSRQDRLCNCVFIPFSAQSVEKY